MFWIIIHNNGTAYAEMWKKVKLDYKIFALKLLFIFFLHEKVLWFKLGFLQACIFILFIFFMYW